MTAERGRRRRRQRQDSTAATSETFHRAYRAFAPVELLNQEAIETVHRRSLELLRDTGIEFMLEEAWPILEANGTAIDRETGIARFDPAAVEHWIAKAPATFDMIARDPAKTLHFGTDEIVYGSASSAPNVLDEDRGRRPGNTADFQDLLRLHHTLASCGMMCGHAVEPIDRAVNTRHLHSVRDWLSLSDKVFRLVGIGTTRVRDGLAMIEIGHGIDRESLRQAPRTLTVLNVNSPMKIDAPLLQGSMELVRNGQCVVVSPVAFAGAMSPITLSGSMIQHNAETLACIAFLQMVAPGSPMFYGSLVTPVDMKSGAPAMGVPETVTGTIAAGQMARRYNLPQRIMLGSTSNAIDAQAAYETMFSLWSGYLAGAHLVYHAHGWMEGGLTTSFEKSVLDAEMIEMMNALARPIDLADADEAMAAIAEVGPGGHFFGTGHTLARYQDAFHAPFLSDWRPYEFWLDDGARDTAARANAAWKERLANYAEPPIDPAIAEALDAFIARRVEEIGDDEV